MTQETHLTTSEDALPLPLESVSGDESDHDAEAGPSTAVAQAQQPLSKNAQKRLAKEARRAEQKLVWRARDKEKKKQKKAEKRKLRDEAAASREDAVEDGPPPAKRARIDHPKRIPFNARVVIDLGFDDKMTSKEVNSLCSQLNHTHSANKRTTRPIAHLLMTGLNGRTKERLDAMNDKAYLRWKGVDWWEEGYEQLWQEIPSGQESELVDSGGSVLGDSSQTAEDGVLAGSTGPSGKGRQSKEHTAVKDSVIYLTADSENEIAELKEGETYIIGGVVDRNRYKNLCQNKAVGQGVRTGRLPIGTYLANMPTRKVLTVNQVFEILVKWTEERDWEKALMHVMPKRKFKDPNANNPQGKEVGDESDNDGDYEEDGAGEVETEGIDAQVGEQIPQ